MRGCLLSSGCDRAPGCRHTAELSAAPVSSQPAGPASSLRLALVLSPGAAVSLGITRFACGLLLPPMRDDLGWSYALAGAMNTSNVAGYLLGVLLMPLLLRRASPGRVMFWGALAASVLMAVSGLFTDRTVWMHRAPPLQMMRRHLRRLPGCPCAASDSFWPATACSASAMSAT